MLGEGAREGVSNKFLRIRKRRDKSRNRRYFKTYTACSFAGASITGRGRRLPFTPIRLVANSAHYLNAKIPISPFSILPQFYPYKEIVPVTIFEEETSKTVAIYNLAVAVSRMVLQKNIKSK